jgi:hypothetical protein
MRGRSTRRGFIQAAGAALPFAAAGVPIHATARSEAQDARLEDVDAIRALNQEFAKARGLEPVDFGEQDVIEVAADRQSATALLHCTVNIDQPIGPDAPLVEMAREQGGGVVRRSERGVFEHEYARRDGTWTIRRSVYRALLIVLFAVTGIASPVFAQWIKYPAEGVPRKNGKPDLTAPAPRLPDGRPDLSGIWHASQTPPCLDSRGDERPCGSATGGSPLGSNLGRNLPGGRLPYQPWAATLMDERHKAMSIDDPHVRCMPDNPPRHWTLPHLTKIVHMPKLLVMLYEVNAMYRQVFLDGRPFPADMNPTWNGYSVGRWDGNSLVVETRGFRDDLWADTQGSPMSDAAKMTEKFTRKNFGSMEIAVTIDDPKVYTKPFTVTLNESLEADTEIIDEFCLEGEKDYERLQRSRGK